MKQNQRNEQRRGEHRGGSRGDSNFQRERQNSFPNRNDSGPPGRFNRHNSDGYGYRESTQFRNYDTMGGYGGRGVESDYNYEGFGNRSPYWSSSHVDYPGLRSRDEGGWDRQGTQGVTEYGRWEEGDDNENFGLGDEYRGNSEWNRNRGSYRDGEMRRASGGGSGMWGRGGPGEGTSGENRGTIGRYGQSDTDRWQSQGEQGSQGQRSRFRAPKGYTRSDERIREEICDTLGRNGRVDPSDVEVQVRDGEVTLTGTIDRLNNKHQIETMVHNVSGVKDVTNNIRIKREGSESRLDGENGSASRQRSPQGTTGAAVRHS